MSGLRNVPFGLKRKILFSHPLARMGIVFVALAVLVFAVFLANVDFNDWKLNKKSPVVDGTIISIKRTEATEDDNYVYEYKYEYTVDGKKYSGVSYMTGKTEIANVQVEYLPSNPEISRIKGMRRGVFGYDAVFFTFFFLLFSIGLLYMGLKKTTLFLKLVMSGKLAYGTLKEIKPTTGKSKGKQIYNAYFSFLTDTDEAYTCIAEVTNTKRLKDEQRELLLYNPQNPKQNVMLDALPTQVKDLLKKEIEKLL